MEKIPVKIVKKIRNSQTGVIMADVSLSETIIVKKSMFPDGWSPEKVMEKGCEATQNIYEITRHNYDRFRYRGLTKEGIKLELIVEADGEVVVFYPLISKNWKGS